MHFNSYKKINEFATSTHHLLGQASAGKRMSFGISPWVSMVFNHHQKEKQEMQSPPLHPHHTLPFLLEVSELRPRLIISLFKYQTQQLASSPWLAANQSSVCQRERSPSGRTLGWGRFSGSDSYRNSPVGTRVSTELCTFQSTLKYISQKPQGPPQPETLSYWKEGYTWVPEKNTGSCCVLLYFIPLRQASH